MLGEEGPAVKMLCPQKATTAAFGNPVDNVKCDFGALSVYPHLAVFPFPFFFCLHTCKTTASWKAENMKVTRGRSSAPSVSSSIVQDISVDCDHKEARRARSGGAAGTGVDANMLCFRQRSLPDPLPSTRLQSLFRSRGAGGGASTQRNWEVSYGAAESAFRLAVKSRLNAPN